MLLNEVQAGTKLELEPVMADGVKLEHTLASKFEWAMDEHEAMIAAPFNEGVIYPLHTGTEMNIYFLVRKEWDINLFRLKAIVTGRGTDENLPLLRIKSESAAEKVQRRKYYRLNCSMAVQYRVVDSFITQLNSGIPFKKTLASNLSGGGICLLLEDKIEMGRLVECEMLTGEGKPVRFFGKVIRYERSESEGKFRYEAGIAYIRINENDREAVVRYIFEEQRILRKKGLI